MPVLSLAQGLGCGHKQGKVWAEAWSQYTQQGALYSGRAQPCLPGFSVEV